MILKAQKVAAAPKTLVLALKLLALVLAQTPQALVLALEQQTLVLVPV
jgi:hypothetical protein